MRASVAVNGNSSVSGPIGTYPDRRDIEMAVICVACIHDISLANGEPLPQHQHTSDEHSPPNTANYRKQRRKKTSKWSNFRMTVFFSFSSILFTTQRTFVRTHTTDGAHNLKHRKTSCLNRVRTVFTAIHSRHPLAMRLELMSSHNTVRVRAFHSG